MERDTAEIYYSKKEQALKAAEQANSMEVFGKQIKVTYYENDDDNKKVDYVSSTRTDIWNRIQLNQG